MDKTAIINMLESTTQQLKSQSSDIVEYSVTSKPYDDNPNGIGFNRTANDKDTVIKFNLEYTIGSNNNGKDAEDDK